MVTRKYKNLWMVEDRTNEYGATRSIWTKVGVALENRDGSYDIRLSAIPVNGRMQMRDPAIREAEPVTDDDDDVKPCHDCGRPSDNGFLCTKCRLGG